MSQFTMSLSLGGTREIYSPEAVVKAMARSEGTNNALLMKTYGRMLDVGAQRFISKPSSSDALAPLAQACPNFQGVVDDLRKYLELALYGSSPLNFVPILLAGEPGVGKTHFAAELAKALNIPHRFVSMGTMTSGWVLSGSSSGWSGARHGKVAQALIEETIANPAFTLDEVDKAGGDHRYDPFGALLQLLEPDTAKHFTDEFLDVEIDTSGIFWVGTANNLSAIPDYILQRMMVYEVPSPTRAQAASIAQSIYSGLLAANGWGFDPDLTDAVLEHMAEVSPREMKKALLDAMGSARLAKRETVLADDVGHSHVKKKTSMGFRA
ncbi:MULTISPECIES: AAA family ATPase [unclassified Variovorax]|nr:MULTISPECIES: AAA family ATPase [unclassified Variovorax]VTU42224.1 Lon protease 2 [Variovorax sp. PBL-H6]PNG49875.1 Lon protease 2 [Variovorax sp. B2]PNG50747.1 Lon protease 2 [Variovorax sp. B4]VTU44155.1 Lon protease 2 [Variovorax sp. SRS16]VTU44236.1 Lon protease 2 [Variovorax sp. PBL-E5]